MSFDLVHFLMNFLYHKNLSILDTSIPCFSNSNFSNLLVDTIISNSFKTTTRTRPIKAIQTKGFSYKSNGFL